MNMVTHVTAKNQFPFQIDQTKRSEVIQIKAIAINKLKVIGYHDYSQRNRQTRKKKRTAKDTYKRCTRSVSTSKLRTIYSDVKRSMETVKTVRWFTQLHGRSAVKN